MKNIKLPDVLFTIGICVIIGGILLGVVLGFVLGNRGFDLVSSITCWLLSIVAGSGFITVSGSINEVNQNKAKDEEFLKMIIEKVQNENK
ncbi:MAG: hypothetical protein ACI4HO_04375 [Ruminococcus sp.]